MFMDEEIVLASASPRRKDLLEAAALKIVVEPSAVDELRRPGEAPMAMVERLAKEKAWADAAEERIVVAADTAVVQIDRVLGKPLDREDARKILLRLSGEEHQVMTGWCVRKGPEERSGVVVTNVWFRQLREEEIERYLDTGEPMDKAGAYGIQGQGGALVDRVEGSYTNVVGLPLAEVLWEIQSFS
jgi:septum formation protein